MNHETAVTIAFWIFVVGTSIVFLAFVAAGILVFCKHKTRLERENKAK